jgi:hypothetical protein
MTRSDTIYKLKVVIPESQDFISSLPDGLFTHFQGMQTEGTFDYKLDFKFNQNKPDQLVLTAI